MLVEVLKFFFSEFCVYISLIQGRKSKALISSVLEVFFQDICGRLESWHLNTFLMQSIEMDIVLVFSIQSYVYKPTRGHDAQEFEKIIKKSV